MPNAILDRVTTPPGVAVTINPLANDVGAGLTIISVTSPVFGSIVVNPDQTLTYTPEEDFEGEDSFSYIIRDSFQSTSQAEVRVAVGQGNRAPVPVADAATVITGGFVDIDVTANDSDPDNDPLFIAAISSPGHGVVQMRNDNKIRYVPQSGFVGADSFSYGVSDDDGAVSTTIVTLEVLTENSIPIVTEDTFTTFVGVPKSISPLANDNDPDMDELRISSLTLPVHGRLALNADQSLLYTPEAGFAGEDYFSYTASDGRGGIASSTVTIRVKEDNLPPVANDNDVSVESGDETVIDLLGDDFDEDGDAIFLTSLTLPFNGQLTFNPDQTVVYTPHSSFVGNDSFTYRISDGRGGEASGQVNLTVTAPPTPSTFQNGYRYRRQLVIPDQAVQSDTILDFVMRVDETNDGLRSQNFGGRVQFDDGRDIRFESMDGTKIAHEIDAYNPSTGHLTAWVRIPQWRVNQAAHITMYYGDPSVIEAEANSGATWTDYLAVWNAQTGEDRSGNGRNLSMSGVGQSELVGDAGKFSSTSRGTLADASWLNDHAALSVQAWISAEQAMIGTDRGFLSQGTIDGSDESQGFELRHDEVGLLGGAANSILWQINTSEGWTRVESETNTQNTDATHVIGTWQDGSLPVLFLQGEASLPSNMPVQRNGVVAARPGPITLGAAARDDDNQGWQGIIDEVRIRTSIMTPEEARIDYASQSAPGLFYGTGDEEVPDDDNQSIVALPFIGETQQGEWVDIDPTALVYNGDSNAVIGNLSSPSNGIASIIQGKIRYTPFSNFIGIDTFSYSLSANGKQSTANIKISVADSQPDPDPDPPTTPDDSFDFGEFGASSLVDQRKVFPLWKWGNLARVDFE